MSREKSKGKVVFLLTMGVYSDKYPVGIYSSLDAAQKAAGPGFARIDRAILDRDECLPYMWREEENLWEGEDGEWRYHE